MISTILFTLILSLPRVFSESPSTADAYALSRGHSFSMNLSLKRLKELRARYSDEFLWFRRAGKEYVVRDRSLLDRAGALFKPLRALAPEQEEIARRDQALSREDEILDREHEKIESETDGAEDSGRAGMSEASLRGLRQRQREIEDKLRELESRQEKLDAEEREIDAREEALEAVAEKQLWRLIDDAIRDGLAKTP